MMAADGKPTRIITGDSEFDELLQRLSGQHFIALDTEFVRTNTFYSRIGLIQLADGEQCFLVDPLTIERWDSFRQFLRNPQLDFVIHSCSEDLNLLQTSIECLPARLFDSQLAAAFLGLGFSLSYQALVRDMLGIEVAKDETRSDWLQRPLSDTQLQYAAADVCYLAELARELDRRLRERDRLDWFEQECQAQLRNAEVFEKPETWQLLYTGVSNAWKLNDAGLAYLQRLCYWREKKARKRNKPKNWIAKDADLFNIAQEFSRHNEQNLDTLRNIDRVDRRFLDRHGKELLAAMTAPDVEFVKVERDLLNTPLNGAQRQLLKACQRAASEQAAQLDMAPELLARKRLLTELLHDYQRYGKLVWQGEMAGWRRQILEPSFSKIFANQSP